MTSHAVLNALSTGQRVILHLGLGAFHRAHQAVYLQALHDLGNTDWSIIAGNLRPDTTGSLEGLQRQRGQYTVETVSPAGERNYQLIKVILQVVPFEPDFQQLIQVAAHHATRIISFTITEAGYYLDSNGNADWSSKELRDDLDAIAVGRIGTSVYAGLTAMLRARRAANSGPVCLFSCDNLRYNGDRSRAALLQFIERSGDAGLLAWVQENTTSPNCMVDRITPRPGADVPHRVKAATGRDDLAAVMAEDFIQWVIEDDFCADRPDWPSVGVQMVTNVAPFEEAKIRILNASHSCIAWAGTLLGYQFIHQGAADPVVRQLAFDYITEDVIPSLSPSPLDLVEYRDTVLARFANPAIEDTNQRVAMDAFSKIPGFIMPTILDRLNAGQSAAATMILPALFLRFLARWHDGLLAYEYRDQAMDVASAYAICEASDPVLAFAADPTLWGSLRNDARLVDGLCGAQDRLNRLFR